MESDDDAFRDIMDVCVGWTASTSAEDKVLTIKSIAEGALNHPGKVINRKAAKAHDFMLKSKDKNLTKDEREAWESRARAVWDGE